MGCTHALPYCRIMFGNLRIYDETLVLEKLDNVGMACKVSLLTGLSLELDEGGPKEKGVTFLI